MDSDAALLESWRAGNNRAGDVLLRRYFDSLYRFFASKVDGAAEDLIQRTLLACVEKTHNVRNPASFRGYLFTVARHELYAYLRGLKKQRARDTEVTTSGLLDLSDSAGTLMVVRQEQRLLLKCLRKLPMDLQIVLGLHYWENLSTGELSEVLDIPQGTVKSRLRRGREELEEQMCALATSPEVLRSTVDNLEKWVASLRGGVKT